jgi:hypothetical protein
MGIRFLLILERLICHKEADVKYLIILSIADRRIEPHSDSVGTGAYLNRCISPLKIVCQKSSHVILWLFDAIPKIFVTGWLA